MLINFNFVNRLQPLMLEFVLEAALAFRLTKPLFDLELFQLAPELTTTFEELN